MARRPNADRSGALFRPILLACPAASVSFPLVIRAVYGGAPGRGRRPGERATTEHGPSGPRAVSRVPLPRARRVPRNRRCTAPPQAALIP